MGKSQHKETTRKCPGCGLKKTFPERNETCGRDCAQKQQVKGTESLDKLVRKFLQKRGTASVADLADRFDRSPSSIRTALDELHAQGLYLDLSSDDVAMPSEIRPGNADGGPLVHDVSEYEGRSFKFGALGDNHLGSKHERLDVLNAAYDLYEKEGVTTVFNTGNWIEGEMRLNFHDVKVHGLDAQIDYMLENYPQREGITTYYVAGDDHEGWYQRGSRLEVGRLLQLRAEDAGRTDLKYLGFVEADIKLKTSKGHAMLKVMHPGGGSAYAYSYAPQKIAESFQGGEKPDVLLIGHYHKFEYCYPRGIHVVQTACTVDQSIFMRKQKISAHVGFTLCELNQAPSGAINRFKVEYFPFYDRAFYGDTRRHFGLTKRAMPVRTVKNGALVA